MRPSYRLVAAAGGPGLRPRARPSGSRLEAFGLDDRRPGFTQRLADGVGVGQAHDTAAELGRTGEALGVPAQVLARHAQARLAAVMREHGVVMLEDDRQALGR